MAISPAMVLVQRRKERWIQLRTRRGGSGDVVARIVGRPGGGLSPALQDFFYLLSVRERGISFYRAPEVGSS